jgi:toxin-antitoxin system PIN domain toxin
VILPDVNILLYAHNVDSPHHTRASAWWAGALSGSELIALPWVTLLGFIRISTNRAMSHRPMTVDEALERVESWLTQPNVRIVHPGSRHAELLTGFLRDLGTAGNLTTDAHLAALAVENGCTLYSTDADFVRFRGLRWRNPLSRR